MLTYLNTNYFLPPYFKFNYLNVGRIEMVPLQNIWKYKYRPVHLSNVMDYNDPQHSQK